MATFDLLVERAYENDIHICLLRLLSDKAGKSRQDALCGDRSLSIICGSPPEIAQGDPKSMHLMFACVWGAGYDAFLQLWEVLQIKSHLCVEAL